MVCQKCTRSNFLSQFAARNRLRLLLNGPFKLDFKWGLQVHIHTYVLWLCTTCSSKWLLVDECCEIEVVLWGQRDENIEPSQQSFERVHYRVSGASYELLTNHLQLSVHFLYQLEVNQYISSDLQCMYTVHGDKWSTMYTVQCQDMLLYKCTILWHKLAFLESRCVSTMPGEPSIKNSRIALLLFREKSRALLCNSPYAAAVEDEGLIIHYST